MASRTAPPACSPSDQRGSAVTAFRTALYCLAVSVFAPCLRAQETNPPADVIRTAKSGPWSAASTWEGNKVPAAGAKVYVRPEHAVLYDVKSEQVIRSVHIDGTLRFAHDKDMLLNVGLIRVGAGGTTAEE